MTIVNDDGHSSTGRAERMRTLLDRVAELAEDQSGRRANVAHPVAPGGVPSLQGRKLPAEVRDLYSITSGGGGAYGFQIVSAERLSRVNDEADELMTEYELMDIGDLPWGPPPIGDAIVALESKASVYVAELDGQPSGVTVLDVGGDEGYRWMAPSLERLFELWVALTEEGLGTVNVSAPDSQEGVVGLRSFDDATLGRASDICHQHSCTLAAVGVWSTR